MDQILFWLFLFYDALVVLPYFWVKVVLGIATGLLIPRKIVGLLVCALANAALFYVSTKHDSSLPLSPLALLMFSIFAFAGVTWWVVGRILRWGILKIGIRFAAAGIMIIAGLWLLASALHHVAFVWFVVRLFWIALALAGGAVAIFGLHLLWEDRLSLLLDNWRARRSTR